MRLPRKRLPTRAAPRITKAIGAANVVVIVVILCMLLLYACVLLACLVFVFSSNFGSLPASTPEKVTGRMGNFVHFSYFYARYKLCLREHVCVCLCNFCLAPAPKVAQKLCMSAWLFMDCFSFRWLVARSLALF